MPVASLRQLPRRSPGDPRCGRGHGDAGSSCPRRPAEHRGDPHGRPVVRHAAHRAAGDALAPVADPGSGRALAVVPERLLQTPLCCPSRATILTGRYADTRAFGRTRRGELFDETNTLATWLHDAGYTTGLIGKYLNRYPFGRGPYVPPGWDRWVAKRNTAAITTYSTTAWSTRGSPCRRATHRPLRDRPVRRPRRRVPADGAGDRPFFLYFAPSAPHPPWTPPIRHAGAFAGVRSRRRRASRSATSRASPVGCRSCLRSTRVDRAVLLADRRHEAETLLGVDDAVERIVGSARGAGRAGRTVILFLTDNGFSFGEHRIRGKRCPYEECIRTPFAARGARGAGARRARSHLQRRPGADDRRSRGRGARAVRRTGGASRPRSSAAVAIPGRRLPGMGGRPRDPSVARGSDERLRLHRERDGTVELYDLTGAIGRADPYELRSRAADPRYRATVGGSPRCCARSAPVLRAEDRLAPIVQQPPDPIIRPASRRRRRPTRTQIARRRAFAALVLAAVVVLAWQFWPFGPVERRRRRRARAPSSGHGNGDGHGGHDGVVGPRQPDQARDLPGEGEPDLQQLLRDLPRCRGHDDGRDADVHERRLHTRAELQARRRPPTSSRTTSRTGSPRGCTRSTAAR